VPFSFLEESDLKDFVHDSDEWMRPFLQPIPELERLGRGRPGRIPKGKPRVTDGTLAGVRRETPKRIIQQLPTGKVTIKKFPELEAYANAILTDEILLNANSGGTPYAKAKKGIKDTITAGMSAAYCFFNRRGERFYADFRRIYYGDIGLEKGKTSEFDSNVMKMTAWYTPMDIKAIIYWQTQLQKMAGERKEKYESEWDLNLLAQLLDAGLDDKDDQHKTPEERNNADGKPGYIKIEHCFQIGTGAMFYGYSPKLDICVKKSTNKDPRGIIPIHLLVPDEDDANPMGESLLAISAGKQNLLDFDMQMYQYSQGLQYSPPVKKFGNVATTSIRLVPDAVIDMGGPESSGNDIQVIDIGNRAQANFSNNYGLIKSQILNEIGSTSDTSISSTSGNPGFSKTDAGVNALQARMNVFENDLRKSTEAWLGRIFETCLNIHFAESKGQKAIEFQDTTVKRLKLNPNDEYTMDYDQEFGPIKFTTKAGTTETSDSGQENEQIVSLLDVTSKYGGLRQDRQMALVNQYISNTGVDDAEDLQYSDDEIEQAKQMAVSQQQAEAAQAQMATEQAMNPQQPVQPAQLPPTATLPDIQMPPSQNMPQQGLSDDEAQTVQLLSSRGYADEQIADAITMLREGYDDNQILQALGAPA
jgi:hypothetical protein